jgi:hypothetical protein
VTTETEVGRIERDEEANLAELGLRLEEAKTSCPFQVRGNPGRK